MPPQRSGFGSHSFLQTAVASQANDLVVEDLVFGCVEMSTRHLGGNGHADGIPDSLAKRAGGTLHTRGFPEFGMTGRLAVQLSEVLDFLKRKIEPGEMEPAVKEHTPVTGGQNETIPIDPLGIRWIDLKILTEQYGPEFGCAEGKPEVPRTACVNGIDGQTSGLISRLLKNFLVLHSRRVGVKPT